MGPKLIFRAFPRSWKNVSTFSRAVVFFVVVSFCFGLNLENLIGNCETRILH